MPVWDPGDQVLGERGAMDGLFWGFLPRFWPEMYIPFGVFFALKARSSPANERSPSLEKSKRERISHVPVSSCSCSTPIESSVKA